MKKFIFMSLAAVMMVLSAVSLVSCGDDNNDSNSNSSSSSSTTQPVFYGYYVVSKDYYNFFDISVERTAKAGSKTYSFTQTTYNDVAVMEYTDECNVTSGETVTVKATVTLKSNWKDIVASKSSFDFYTGVGAGVYSGTSTHSTITWGGGTASASEITEDYLNNRATALASKFSGTYAVK